MALAPGACLATVWGLEAAEYRAFSTTGDSRARVARSSRVAASDVRPMVRQRRAKPALSKIGGNTPPSEIAQGTERVGDLMTEVIEHRGRSGRPGASVRSRSDTHQVLLGRHARRARSAALRVLGDHVRWRPADLLGLLRRGDLHLSSVVSARLASAGAACRAGRR